MTGKTDWAERLYNRIDAADRHTNGVKLPIGIFVALLVAVFWVWFWTPGYDVTHTIWWFEARFWWLFDGDHQVPVSQIGGMETRPAREVAGAYFLAYPASRMAARIVFAIELGCFTLVVEAYALRYWRLWYRAHVRRVELQTGVDAATPEEIRRMLRWRGTSPCRLGDVPFVKKSETRHIAIIGGKGKGKTPLMADLVRQIMAEGDAAIIHDPTGFYLSRFYDHKRGDVILNPFDVRSARWSLSAEIESPIEADRMAALLIPGKEGGRIASLRTLLSALFWQTRQLPNPTLGSFFRFLINEPADEFVAFLRDTPAGAMLAGLAKDDLRAMRAELGRILSWLQALPRQDKATSFSVGDWMAGLDEIKERKPLLFLTGAPDLRDRLHMLAPLWLDLAALSLVSRPELTKRRVWFLLDDLHKLGRITQLESLQVQGSSRGAAMVFACESQDQLRQIYGTETGSLLTPRCGTIAMLKAGYIVSRRFADDKERGRDPSDPVILPPIMGPGPVSVFVKLPAKLPIARTLVPEFDHPVKAEAFVPTERRTSSHPSLAGKEKGAIGAQRAAARPAQPVTGAARSARPAAPVAMPEIAPSKEPPEAPPSFPDVI